MICTLSEKDGIANWCERHKRHHHGHYAQYAVDPGEKGEQFRKFWDRQLKESNSPKLLRSLPLASQCRHLDPHRLTNDEAAHLSETAYKLNTSCRACSKKTILQRCHGGGGIDGYTTIAHCAGKCADKFELEPGVATDLITKDGMPVSKHAAWKPITTRHLLYHIYPVANGHWRWNVEQLCGRLKAFNGQKIIAIVTDPPTGRLPDPDGPNSPDRGRHIPGCDSAEQVKEEFRQRWPHDDITFLEMDNDPSLREVKTIMPMLEKVLSDDQTHSLLYAQAKGTTRHHGHIARRWTEALYEIMFDYFPLADKQLMEYPVTGCFKKLGQGWSADQSRSDWHYSGSWFWVRCAELHRRAWWNIDAFWSGIEPYPSQQFLAQESGCMFHVAKVPEMNLYSSSYWKKTIHPEFHQWRQDNAQYRTTLWPR